MNRRQLLGASLAGIIAALSLPFEQFAEWCRSWLGQADVFDPYEERLCSYPHSDRMSVVAKKLYERIADEFQRAYYGQLVHGYHVTDVRSLLP